MYVSFEELADTSRIWVYQSDRKLTDDEVHNITPKLREFVHAWTAHNAELKASYTIKDNIFVILGVDQSQTTASGCSIDSSVRQMKELGSTLNVNFFDRQRVVVMDKDKPFIYGLNDLKLAINNNQIDRQSIFFNNLASSKAELSSNWQIPLEKTWLVRYIK